MNPVDPSTDPINRMDESERNARLRKQLGENIERFICPITTLVMVDPVLSAAGRHADRFCYYQSNSSHAAMVARCPFTRQSIDLSQLIPDIDLRNEIDLCLDSGTIQRRNEYYRSLREEEERAYPVIGSVDQQSVLSFNERFRQTDILCQWFTSLNIWSDSSFWDITSEALQNYICDHLDEMKDLVDAAKKSQPDLSWEEISEVGIEKLDLLITHLLATQACLFKRSDVPLSGWEVSGIPFHDLVRIPVARLSVLLGEKRLVTLIQGRQLTAANFMEASESAIRVWRDNPEQMSTFIEKMKHFLSWTAVSEEVFDFCMSHQEALCALKMDFPKLSMDWISGHRDTLEPVVRRQVEVCALKVDFPALTMDWIADHWALTESLLSDREEIHALLQQWPHLAPNFLRHAGDVRGTVAADHRIDWSDEHDPVRVGLCKKEQKLAYRDALCRVFSDWRIRESKVVTGDRDTLASEFNRERDALKEKLRQIIDEKNELSGAEKDHLERHIVWPLIEDSIKLGLLLASPKNLKAIGKAVTEPYLFEVVWNIRQWGEAMRRAFPNGVPAYYQSAFRNLLHDSRRFNLTYLFHKSCSDAYRKREIMCVFKRLLREDVLDSVEDYKQSIFSHLYRELDGDEYNRSISSFITWTQACLDEHLIHRFAARIYGVPQLLVLLGNVLIFIVCPLIPLIRLALHSYDPDRHPDVFWLPKTQLVQTGERWKKEIGQLQLICEWYENTQLEGEKGASAVWTQEENCAWVEASAHRQAIEQLLTELPQVAPHFLQHQAALGWGEHTIDWENRSDPAIQALMAKERHLAYRAALCRVFSDWHRKEMAQRAGVPAQVTAFDVAKTLHWHLDENGQMAAEEKDGLERALFWPLIEASLETGIALSSAHNLCELRMCLDQPYVGELVALLIALGKEVSRAFPDGVPLYYQRTLERFMDKLRDDLFERCRWREMTAIGKRRVIMGSLIYLLPFELLEDMAPCIGSDHCQRYPKLFVNREIWLDTHDSLSYVWNRPSSRGYLDEEKYGPYPWPRSFVDAIQKRFYTHAMCRFAARVHGIPQVLALVANLVLFLGCPMILLVRVVRYLYVRAKEDGTYPNIFWLPKTPAIRTAEQWHGEMGQLRGIFDAYCREPVDAEVPFSACAASTAAAISAS